MVGPKPCAWPSLAPSTDGLVKEGRRRLWLVDVVSCFFFLRASGKWGV